MIIQEYGGVCMSRLVANWENEAHNTNYSNTRNSLYDLQEVGCIITGMSSDSTHCHVIDNYCKNIISIL